MIEVYICFENVSDIMPERRIRTHKYSDKVLRKWKKDWRWVDGHPSESFY